MFLRLCGRESARRGCNVEAARSESVESGRTAVARRVCRACCVAPRRAELRGAGARERGPWSRRPERTERARFRCALSDPRKYGRV